MTFSQKPNKQQQSPAVIIPVQQLELMNFRILEAGAIIHEIMTLLGKDKVAISGDRISVLMKSQLGLNITRTTNESQDGVREVILEKQNLIITPDNPQ